MIHDVFGRPIELPDPKPLPRPLCPGDVVNTRNGHLVVVSGVFETWVMAMILSSPDPRASFPAFLARPVGMPELVVWPESMFGLCTSRINQVVTHIPNFHPEGIGFGPLPSLDSPGAMTALERVVGASWEAAGDFAASA